VWSDPGMSVLERMFGGEASILARPGFATSDRCGCRTGNGARMTIITATSATQGQRVNDYHWCIEGEIVLPAVVICRRDRDDPDGGCGCGRGWSGANSHRATTTAVVRDVAFTLTEYTEAIRSSLEHGGWWPDTVDDGGVTAMVAYLTDIAASHPIGAVLERRLDAVARR